MKCRPLFACVWIARALAVFVLGALGAGASDLFLISKGLVYSQSAGSSPAPLATGGSVFIAETPDYGGPPIVTAGSVTLPNGSSQSLAHIDSQNVFRFTDTSASAGNYPAGAYTISLASTLISGLTATVNLPAANFPPVPQISNLSAAGSVQATNDFTISFQPFAGAGANDDAAIEFYSDGALAYSDAIDTSASSYLLTANTLDPNKSYAVRLRFRHVEPSELSFPPSGYAFFSETRFTLSTQLLPAVPPKMLLATPVDGEQINGPLDTLQLIFDTPMNTNLTDIAWSATKDGAPFALQSANFQYRWFDPHLLSVSYASTNGGWPAGLVVSWRLNGSASNSNFVSVDGTPLPTNTYSGFFLTTADCGCNTAPALSDWAPTTLAGSLLTITVTNGAAPYLTSGVYQVFTSLAATNYVALGNPGGGFSAGAYTYAQTATNSGTLRLTNSTANGALGLRLDFASATVGAVTATDNSGQIVQRGQFSFLSYSSPTPPEMIAPTSQTTPQLYVGGQEGLILGIESSADILHWSTEPDLLLTNLSSALGNIPPSGSRFFRAFSKASALAPDSLTNHTLNLSITSGNAPLPVHGTYQWLAAAESSTFQVRGMTATTNFTGSYTYAKISGDSATLVWTDKGWTMQLAFTSTTKGFYFLSIPNSTGAQWGRFSLYEGDTLYLGNIAGAPDTSRAASLNFSPGVAATLTVTNAAGYIWSLNFPADSLSRTSTITMTPYASIDSSAAAAPVISGVLLEPDGTRFADAVTLSVKPPQPLSAHASLVLGNHDGSDIQFVRGTNGAGVFSTTLFHFTSGGVSDSSADDFQKFVDEHLPAARAQFDNALAAVQAMRRPVVIPSAPPDDDWPCDPKGEAAATKALNEYLEKLFEREDGAISRLMSATRNLMQLIPDEAALYDNSALEAARDLVQTAYARKINTLWANYGKNVLKLRALSNASFSVMRRERAVAGGSLDWFDSVRTLTIKARDHYFDEFKTEHAYNRVVTTLELSRNLAALGVGDDGLLAELQSALKFKLHLKFELSGLIDPAAQISESAEGDIDVAADDAFNMTGEGSIHILSGHIPAGNILSPTSFDQRVFIADFKVCTNQSAIVAISPMQFSEVWPTPDGNTATLPQGYLGNYFDGAYGQLKLADGSFALQVNLQNRNEIAAQQTFTKSFDAEKMVVTITLKHTPQ